MTKYAIVLTDLNDVVLEEVVVEAYRFDGAYRQADAVVKSRLERGVPVEGMSVLRTDL